jgi:hypothetical protein
MKIVRTLEDHDPTTGAPIWRLTMAWGHERVRGRHGDTPPTSRPVLCGGNRNSCTSRAHWKRRDAKRNLEREAEREAAQRRPTEAERAFAEKCRQLMTIA